MGTQPVQRNNSQLSDPWVVVPQRAITEEERRQMIEQIADRMARSFADAVIAAQDRRQIPLREKFAIVVLAGIALIAFAGIPGYLVTGIVLNFLGFRN